MTSTSAASSHRLSEGDLARYLRDIRRFPMLKPEDEKRLARCWRENDDRSAADRLVTSHLRLVVKIANQYRRYGLSLAEVISEGNIGLMRAASRFDPDMGCRFGTYARWWIKATIREYLFRSWSLVRIANTDCQKNLFFNLRKVKQRLSALHDGDLDPDQVKIIADYFGVPEKDVIDMNRRLMGDRSLNSPTSDDSDASEWQDWLVDDRPSQETELATSEDLATRRNALGVALKELDAREHRIFVARHLAEEPTNLTELGQELGLSCEGVRRIEIRAYEKVRKAVRTSVRRARPAHAPTCNTGSLRQFSTLHAQCCS